MESWGQSLITDAAELRALFVDYAERRVRFTRSRLAASSLSEVLRSVEDQDGLVGWSDAGVSDEVLERLRQSGVEGRELHLVFAHPSSVAAQPARLDYYKRLLSMSDKVFQRVYPRLARLRRRASQASLSSEERTELTALNELLELIADLPDFSIELPIRLVTASEGASIDGDWRNQTGRIATWRTMEAILACLDRSEIVRLTATSQGASRDITHLSDEERIELVDAGWRPDALDVTGGFRVRFGPQQVDGRAVNADITIAALADDQPSRIVSVGEVKGASDPANAKERWRLAAGNIAAMDRIRSGRAGSRPTTFYVGLLITEAVVSGDAQLTGMRELLERRTLDAAFSLLKFSKTGEWERFRTFFRAQIGR